MLSTIIGLFKPRKKLTSMDTETLTKRIEECVIPDDREIILDYLEMMDEKMENEKDALVFKECKGVLILMKILKKMMSDAIIVRLALTVLDSARPYKEVIMDFIQYGGVDLLQKIGAEHDKELFLMVFVPQFLKDILAIGAAAAMIDITYEESNLLMCRNCQEVLERAKFKGILGLVDVKVPKTSDRVNRVVMFMENYTNRRDVQLLALDALMTYAKNSDCPSSIMDTEVIANIGICMTTFIKDPDIIWRGCVVLWKVALFSPEICREVGLLQIHETLAIEYDTYKADPRVQQQVLWLFNSLLTYPKGRRIVHESEVSMALFKRLLAQRDLDVGNLKNVARADQLKPFEVVIPHQIRAFLRETRGLILGQRAPEEDEAAAKLQSDAMAAKAKGRKNFDPVPRYSTVEEEFKDGIPGLVDERKLTKKEQEEQAIKAEEAGSVNDWGLTYGKKKTGAKIAPTSTSTQMVPLSKKTNKT